MKAALVFLIMVKVLLIFSLLFPFIGYTDSPEDTQLKLLVSIDEKIVEVPISWPQDPEMIEDFRQFTPEEKVEFLHKRQIILEGVLKKILNQEVKIGYFQMFKNKVVSVIKLETWKNLFKRNSNIENQKKLPLRERAKNQGQQSLVDIMNGLDHSLWKNSKRVVSAKDWGMVLGAGFLAAAGFREKILGVKSTFGLGFILGIEVNQNFSDLSIHQNKILELEVAKKAIVPTMIAAITGRSFLYLNNADQRMTIQNHETTYLPLGPTLQSNNEMNGFGIAAGVSFTPVVSTVAFFKMSATRYRVHSFSDLKNLFVDLVKKGPSNITSIPFVNSKCEMIIRSH